MNIYSVTMKHRLFFCAFKSSKIKGRRASKGAVKRCPRSGSPRGVRSEPSAAQAPRRREFESSRGQWGLARSGTAGLVPRVRAFRIDSGIVEARVFFVGEKSVQESLLSRNGVRCCSNGLKQ
jgi:hypothetical protein